MSLATLIATHGYWILAFGCLLEGETVLVLAAYAAHRGYLNPAAVVAIALASVFASNQFFFWLGRRHGTAAGSSSAMRRLPPSRCALSTARASPAPS